MGQAAAVKERPIIMSGDSVQAILVEAKTQTRRVIVPQPDLVQWPARPWRGETIGRRLWRMRAKVVTPAWWGRLTTADHPQPMPPAAGLKQELWIGPADATGKGVTDNAYAAYCPHGAPGDRLWVKEAWAIARCSTDYETGGETNYYEWTADDGDPSKHLGRNARYETAATLHYRADGEERNPTELYPTTDINDEVIAPAEIRWRSPMFMPRWASRLTLEVTAVRVERVQDISEADAEAEGVDWIRDSSRVRVPGQDSRRPTAVECYRWLWNQLNAARGFPWSANPWVWSVTFRRVENGPRGH